MYGQGPTPDISVILPTFRRAQNGLFHRAVSSILDQTLPSLEVIIIDDGSTDGTAHGIGEFMRQDGRVSCLRHPRNIGLPAISEYEGYLKARADYLAFAFDDDRFYPGALSKLLEHAKANPRCLCYGHVVMRILEKGSTLEKSANLGCDLAQHNLRSWNCISNNAALMPRFMIADIGFYDPHVVISRLCDWDLWRRVGEKYMLKYVEVPVGEVTGPATSDSLGKTYALDMWASEEWMRTSRNSMLRPETIEDYEIFRVGSAHSRNTRTACRDASDHHLRSRPWMTGIKEGVRPDGQILVVNSPYEASTTIYFDYLPESVRSRVRIFQSRSPLDVAELGRAGCVVFVRHMELFQHLIDAAISLEVPCYYFLDDNFSLLQSGNKGLLKEDHRIYTLKSKLRNFAGVLLSTPALKNFFEENLLHSNICLFPPCFATLAPIVDKPPAYARGSWLTIAFAGGKHRHAGLKKAVLPALESLSKKGIPLHVVIAGADDSLTAEVERFENPNLKLSCELFEVDWKRALLKIAAHNPHILIHAPSDSANNKYKSLNVAASAWLLNTVLVVPDCVPYARFASERNAVLVSSRFEKKSWLDALELLAGNTESWGDYLRRNTVFCRGEFSGAENERVLCEILRNAPPVGITTIENRFRDLYKMRETSGFAGLHFASVAADDLQLNLRELARIRSRKRHSTVRRLLAPASDLWPEVAPEFDDIKRFLVGQDFHRPGSLLELTDSLHDQDFLEYRVPFPPGVLKKIYSVFSTDGVQKGTVGIELLEMEGKAIFSAIRDLSKIDLHGPVEFDLGAAQIFKPTEFRVRLFARSAWPVYTFELVRYGPLRLSRHIIAPFLKLGY
jgi:glycosyltransferase involved in cell wall biosynthesis